VSRSDSSQRVLRALECASWTVGATLLVLYAGARLHGTARAQDAIERFREASAVRIDTRLWSESRIEAYRKHEGHAAADALAVLRIDRVGLSVPVFRGTDGPTLDVGAGWIEGTAMPGSEGNSGIAGHRDGFFRHLKDVVEGDLLELEGPGGTNRFVVREMRVVEPEAIGVLAPTDEPTLTLVTCYPFYFVGPAPQRFIVRATAESAGGVADAARRADR